MGIEGWITLAVVAGITIGMARERLGPDIVMLLGLSTLVVSGILDPAAAVSGFANPALITIALLFVVTSAVEETGGIHLVTRFVSGNGKDRRGVLPRLLVPTALLSGFVNNTPIVAMLVPVVREFTRRVGESPSRYLMPVSFAAMLGGTTTLIGTSANLVVAGALQKTEHAPLGMLEITRVGLPTALIGLLYLLVASRYLVKPRVDPIDVAHAEAREYLAEVGVRQDSPLVGRTVEKAGMRHLPGLFLVEIRRHDRSVVRPVAPEDVIQGGDKLVFTGVASTVGDLRTLPGIEVLHEPELEEEPELFEVVLSHRSDLVGQSVRDSDFRRRFDAAILAVHRAGERIEEKIGRIVLRAGDALMLSAAPGFRRVWRDSPHFYLVSTVEGGNPPRYRKAPIALGALLGLVAVPALTNGAVSMLTSAMGALLVLLLTGCISPRGARRSVNGSVLVVIGAALGVAEAMEETGAAAFLAGGIVDATAPFGAVASLAGIYLLGVVMASFISNSAAAALVFPVAISAATSAGLDPRAFAIAVAMAASAVFCTPMSYANLLIYGPGGYRYGDFARLGLPLNLVCFVVAMALIPFFWPLQGG